MDTFCITSKFNQINILAIHLTYDCGNSSAFKILLTQFPITAEKMACSLALFNIVISIASLMAIELPPEIHFYQNVSNPFFKPAPISGTAKYLLLWADVRTAILEAHEEVCGETRLCTSKEDDKLSRSKCSVCETCFCDDMCQHYGDCCIDKIIDDHLLDEPVYLTDKVPGKWKILSGSIKDCLPKAFAYNYNL